MAEQADRLELVDGSGPASPKYQFATKIVVEGRKAVREQRDARGTVNDERVLSDAEWDALVDAIAGLVPLGTTLDLVGAEKRRNKGVAFNTLRLVARGSETKIDYLPSHLEDDAKLAAVVERVKTTCSAG